MKYTTEQKIQALRREIALRKNVYKRRIAEGKMTEEQAQNEIAIMEEILEEYIRLTSSCAVDIESRLDAFLTQQVEKARERGSACVVPSAQILEATGCAPRQLGALMQARGWVRVWISAGTRGWMLPVSRVSESDSNSKPITVDAAVNSKPITVDAAVNSKPVTVDAAVNSKPITVDDSESGSNSKPVTVEAPANSKSVTVESPANSKPVTVDAGINSKSVTVDDSESGSNSKAVTVECDHRLTALRDLAQRMDVYLWKHLALQMVEKIEQERVSLCARCTLVKNTVLSTRYGFTAEDMRKAVLDVLAKKPEMTPPTEDIFALIPEEVRAESDVVVEILNLLGGVASQAQLEKSLRKRGYKQPYDVLLRVKPVLSDFVNVTRGSDGEVWKLR
ncbi:MAG: hypothetical protein KatS3mg023_0578 [Armatimonadota bacterium]|nr:MAG: hypothetical protein KatS3mg023_0578 [Armatimonadota bacterium]